MDQVRQLQNNLRQTRQNLNSVLGQVNQQLQNSEQIAQNIGTQLSQQQTQWKFGTGTNVGTFTQSPTGFGQSYLSNVGNTNQFNQSSMQRGGGVNQFGARYSSGNRDGDISQSYYQTSQLSQPTTVRSQYNPGTSGTLATSGITSGVTGTTSQYGGTRYGHPSMQTGSVSPFGARYTSGIQDEEVGQSYYQGTTSGSMGATNSALGSTSGALGSTTNNAMGATSGSMNTTNSALGSTTSNALGATGGTMSAANNTMGATGANQYSRSQYGRPSVQQNAGSANQYGAQYSSGIKDENISQSYYQSNQGTLS